MDARLQWNSSRIQQNGEGNHHLALDPSLYYSLWRPDIFIRNAKDTKLHAVRYDIAICKISDYF